MKSIVAFAGRKSSGKSTHAALLAAQGYTELSLAAELKRVAGLLFPRTMTEKRLHGSSSSKDLGFSVDERRIAFAEVGAAIVNIKHDPDIKAVLTPLFKGSPLTLDGYDMAEAFARVFAPGHAEKRLASPRTILQVLGTEWGRKLWDEVWLDSVRRTVRDKEGKWVIPDARFANEVVYLKQQLGAAVYWLDAERRLGPNTDPHASEPSRDALIGLCDGEFDANGAVEATRDEIARVVLA